MSGENLVRRWPLPGLAITAAVAAACGGGMGPSEEPVEPPPPSLPLAQAGWPDGSEDPDLLFAEADAAFYRGDYPLAQRLFGTLFLVAPDYNGGVPMQALVETCNRIPDNCDLVLPRLYFLRDAWLGMFGPREQWFPQQEWDFVAILECYDRAIHGDFLGAVQVGGPITQAPLQGFAEAATACVGPSDLAVQQLAQQQLADQAFAAWEQNYPCVENWRPSLLEAFRNDDWETFATIYPQYQVCASVIQQIVDDGVLSGDSRLGSLPDVAYTNLSEVSFIMEENRDRYDSVRDALVSLDSDREYNRLLVDWESLDSRDQDVTEEIGQLTTARDALSGPTRETLQVQIDALQAEQRELRRQMRDTMGEINARRRAVGLPTRERP